MNKRLLDLCSGIGVFLTMVSGISSNKELLPLVPPAWAPYVAYASAFATVALRILAFYAPPTPSPSPPNEQPKPPAE